MEQILVVSAGRAALAIAHPGHELRVFGWMQRARPLVLALTDGSGGKGASRLASTERILRQTGARPGCLFGRFPDRQIYQAVLEGNTRLFLDLAVELALELVRNHIEVVVGDAAEGAILTHDLWRGVVNRAIWLAQPSLQLPLASYEFLLEEPHTNPAPSHAEALMLRLSDAELKGKIAATRSYPELSQEVEAVISSEGEESLRSELFIPSQVREANADSFRSHHYELHGERQVAAGVYSQVVRYHQHVLPILQALQQGRRPTNIGRQLREAA
ncbi:MAG: hypothetical protein ACR2FY_20770 [Pirellulaceae bacterium]